MGEEHLEKCKELFFRYGVKNVTMDMISQELGISKRTLYEMVRDKKTLVSRTMDYFIDQHKNELSRIFDQSKTAVQILAEITGYAINLLSRIHPSLIFEIQRYYFDVWKKMEIFLATFVMERFVSLLKQGQKEGYFDGALNPELIAHLHYRSIMTILDDTLLEHLNLSKSERVYHYFYFLIRGICTEKGIKAYHEEIIHIFPRKP